MKLSIVPSVVLHVGGRSTCRHKYEINAGAGRDPSQDLRCQNRICSETFYEFVTDPASARLQVSIMSGLTLTEQENSLNYQVVISDSV